MDEWIIFLYYSIPPALTPDPEISQILLIEKWLALHLISKPFRACELPRSSLCFVLFSLFAIPGLRHQIAASI